MKGAETLIPVRFLTLTSHLCVVITLLWETNKSIQLCLPSQQHVVYFQLYHTRLVAGLASSLVLIIIEFATFIFGLTMFSPSVCLLSSACHGAASIILTYMMLYGWQCDWYWPLFALCSVLPVCVDVPTALLSIYSITSELQQLTSSREHRGGWSFWLVLAGIATTFGSSLPVGYHIGVVNTPADVITRFCNESFVTRYDLQLSDRWLNVLWSSVVSIFIVGGCTGSILGAVLANNLGRKMATITTSVMSLIGAVLFVLCQTANSVEMLILGRLIVGLSAGLTTSIVPMYLAELAPAELTGAMGIFCPMGVNVGVLVGQVMGLKFLLGRDEYWPYLLSVYASLVIICLPMLFMLPESPKYLFVVKRNEEMAIKELSRLRSASASMLVEDIEVLREEARSTEASAVSDWGMLRVLLDPKLRLLLLLTCAIQAGQQTSGINAVFYYSQKIFRQAGLTAPSAQYATIGCGFINVCTAVLMVKLLPRHGRRPLLLWSTLSATLILAALAVCMLLMKVVFWMPYVSTVAVFLYVLAYGFGLGPIPYFIASEMFEVGPRPAGMAWGSLANWGGNFLVGMSFPSMRDAIGPYSFLVFSAVTGALYVLQRLYLPETRGKTPAQVTQLCSRGFRSRPLRATVTSDV